MIKNISISGIDDLENNINWLMLNNKNFREKIRLDGYDLIDFVINRAYTRGKAYIVRVSNKDFKIETEDDITFIFTATVTEDFLNIIYIGWHNANIEDIGSKSEITNGNGVLEFIGLNKLRRDIFRFNDTVNENDLSKYLKPFTIGAMRDIRACYRDISSNNSLLTCGRSLKDNMGNLFICNYSFNQEEDRYRIEYEGVEGEDILALACEETKEEYDDSDEEVS